MIKRSLQASQDGIKKAQRALIRYSLTQRALAADLGISRQPVGKFFTGKPVDRNLFAEICHRLDLEWEKVIVQPLSEPEPHQQNQDDNLDVDVFVQEVREKIKPDIQERCGTMRVLDMSQPIGLKEIYTHVNILEKITGRRRKEIAELLQEYTGENFERFGLSRIAEERIPGLTVVKKYPKLMILGKPGAGKTTFLKYLAIQCIGGEFQTHLIPIFITLKDFAEAENKPTLLDYITGTVGGRYAMTLPDTLLKQGRAFVLLDGLDEVREEDSQRVLKEIRDFSDYFRDNHFVITCRIAAREYTFEKFTEVEIADFNKEQIQNFATNWFHGKAVKSKTFLQRIEENKPIRELATNPLLLTLLCLAFEETGDFPANRSELYKEGLDALLKKWDAKRGIHRDHAYKKLSSQRKEDLLSKIALTTFEQGDYFLKQKVAEQYVTHYIRNLPGATTDEEALQLDSEVVLRSIEAQHGLLVERAKGIYSFSHLTFHEYFTAREIVVVKQSKKELLQNLVNHLNEKRWREVLLLTIGMSPSADGLFLLMKDKVDAILAQDENLQQFLMWASEKSRAVEAAYEVAAIRAFYLFYLVFDGNYNNFGLTERTIDDTRVLNDKLEIIFLIDVKLCTALSNNYAFALTLELKLYQTFAKAFLYCFYWSDFEVVLGEKNRLYNIYQIYNNFLRVFELAFALDPALKQVLLQLSEQLPSPDGDEEHLKQWWDTNGQVWTNQLRAMMIEHRNIGHDWQFSIEQKKVLKQYYDANKLLVECLNSDCYVSREVRQEIEDTLLLPIAEIENYQQRIL
ncbi:MULTISPECIES: NACHT domain-containing protein [unclassified Coleofasciculus]|uniref:NACHT domain-containing protein n=1 Tax=unclassified Coleofasciculus TaxID=2692782 RepID=UPI00187DF99D|nr:MULTISPECIES: NACHT domain-containing NTPase [unclassified Coleofasciculus]MBE9125300.1 NACHT domain-containing NTPase [Coleofasciculus sp. LEGE 07081]MBE9147081.1 NACHT domain-containing NTPase [Coleofasciculus sp. LEGE 07092]